MNRRTLAIASGLGLLAAALRAFGLRSNPNGLFCDEASTGYDAFCLFHTGRDQYGELLPLFARSFGDYNEALYRYLTVPAVALFGLDELSVRLPAAVAGTLTVVALFALGRCWYGQTIGLVSALLLAVSPWHVPLSRAGFRGILFPLFFCIALWSFDRGVKKHTGFLWASAGAFGLALYSYSTARLFVPLFLLVLCTLYRNELRERWRQALIPTVALGVFALILANFWFSEAGMARGGALIVWDVGAIASNYFSYLSPSFLFLNGDPELLHSPTGFGQLHRVEVLTVLVGLVVLLSSVFRRRPPRRPDVLLLAWILLFPLAAALTEEAQAMRALIGAPALALVSSMGAVGLCRALPRLSMRRAVAVALALAIGASAVLFAHHLFVRYPVYSARHWQYGMRRVVEIAVSADSDCVVLSDRLYLPHIFDLFYRKVPPETYQSSPLWNVGQKNWSSAGYRMGHVSVPSSPDALGDDPECVVIAPVVELVEGTLKGEVVEVIPDPEENAWFVVVRPDRR